MPAMTAKHFSLRLLAAFAAFNLAVIFAPITPYGLLFVLLVAAAMLLLDHRNSLLMVFSCLLLVLVLEGFVRFSGGSVITPYYRAHEMLAEETRYQANRHVEMREEHGDLLAIDPQLDRALAQPREMVFNTDSRGFRNDADLRDERLLIVGDSFVVGIGNTQADMLTAQLGRNHGITAYSMGFPAGPFQYANTVEAARAELGDDACIVVVMFEGNDFQPIDPTELAARKAVPRGAQDFIKAYFGAVKAPFEVSRVFYGLYTRGMESLRVGVSAPDADAASAASDVTFVRQVAGGPMIFLKGYADVVQRDSYDDFGYIQEQFTRGRPDLLVFAPEKYRVYGPLLDEHPAAGLPRAQPEHLARVAAALNVPLLDLTDAMLERSRELLQRGELTYWRDDTHWNPAGIETAARELARELSAHDKPACRGLRTTGLSAMLPDAFL